MTGLRECLSRQRVIWRKGNNRSYIFSDRLDNAQGFLGTRLTPNDLIWWKENLVVSVGHEFRSPLTVIKGFLELLIKEDGRISDVQRQEVYRMMRECVDDLCSLVETAVSAADLTLKDNAVTLAPVDLRAVIADAVAQYTDAAHGKMSSLKVEVEDAGISGVVMGSCRHLRDMVYQVIRLFEAALTLDREAALRIGLCEDRHQVTLRFFLGCEKGHLVKQDLNGLALYFVQKVVDTHGGRFSFEGACCGAVVVISIPKEA